MIENICVSYGPINAVKNVSLTVEDGEIVALLGSNGTGKTTILNAISRLYPVKSGSIFFRGENITRLAPHEVVCNGLSHAPEGRRIFAELTVRENLELGAYIHRDKTHLDTTLKKVYHYFPLLVDRQHQKGGTLSGGEQQMLAIGRALMSAPKLLMLDEPSLGLAPMIVEKIFTIIQQINREENVAIFLVEQNANEALLHSHRAYILETGSITLSGQADDLRHDPQVIAAYLGG